MSGKTIGTCVCECDRLVQIIECGSRQHWAKHFLPCNFRLWFDVSKNRRSKVVSPFRHFDRGTGGFETGCHRAFDESTHLVEVACADERTELARPVRACAHTLRSSYGTDAIENPLIDRAMHIESRAAVTNLSGIEKACHRCLSRGSIQVGVVADDRGRLAAEFQRHALKNRDT